MLHFPIWKRIIIWGLCATALIFAMPNLFYDRVERYSDAERMVEMAGEIATDEQGADLDLWPSWLPSTIVHLGLDLRGGAHLLAEVQVEDVYADRMDALWPAVRDMLRDERDTVGGIRRQDSPADELRVQISEPDGMSRALELVRDLAQPVSDATGAGSDDIDVSSDGDEIVITLSDAERRATDDRTMRTAVEIVRNRIDEVGTREPNIQRQGSQRILIQVPGVDSAEEIKELIGTTARLTFHAVLDSTSDPDTTVESGEVLYPSMEEEGRYYLMESSHVVSGEQLVDAQPSFDENNRPAVNFRFNPAGGRTFGDFTAENIGSPFAIVLDEEVISAPVIRSHIPGGSGIITGDFTVEESTQLAILLRSGALPAELTFLEERTIGPELGQDSIDAGRIASIVALTAVLGFMMLSYGMFGIIANIALLLNIGMIFGLLSLIGATLTLPGIAGIVLTIGMAVDATVLILERIREELRTAKGPARAIELGYEKAMSAILDANITTFITAGILFAMGAGPVRGFAVTLGLGILTSVFTALFITRLMIVMWFERKRPKTFAI